MIARKRSPKYNKYFARKYLVPLEHKLLGGYKDCEVMVTGTYVDIRAVASYKKFPFASPTFTQDVKKELERKGVPLTDIPAK